MEGIHIYQYCSKPKQININKFKLTKMIRIGENSQFYIAENIKNQEKLCVKVLGKKKVIDQNLACYVGHQILVMNSINFPFIVSFYGFDQDSRFLYLAMQYLQGRELYNYFNTTYNPSFAQFYFSQIYLTLEYLHQRSFVYRNLKPQNIMLSKDGYIKLIDFGLSKKINYATKTICGTPEFMAPEIIKRKIYGIAADWWSLGIWLYEFLIGETPFYDEDPLKIYKNILERKVKFPKNFEDENAKSMIKHLLIKEPQSRYGSPTQGISKIKQHKFMKGVNLPMILARKQIPPLIPLIIKQQIFQRLGDSLLNKQFSAIDYDQDPFRTLFTSNL